MRWSSSVRRRHPPVYGGRIIFPTERKNANVNTLRRTEYRVRGVFRKAFERLFDYALMYETISTPQPPSSLYAAETNEFSFILVRSEHLPKYETC